MESALQIPEVLSNILELADCRTQTIVARTSRTWSEPALNTIWRHLDSVVPLLKLLAPLRRIPYPSMWELDHLPSVDAWERFKLIAPRVRSLAHHDEQTIEGRDHSHLAFVVFMDLAVMIPGSVPLLPNLRDLDWHIVRVDSPVSLVFLFLNPNLRRLSLEMDIGDIPSASFNNLLQHLPIRCPLLTHFNLYTHMTAREIHTALATCIKKLRSLQVVGLPPCYHTDVVVEALAVAPALVELRTGWLAAAPAPNPEESQVEFREGWFRTLERLDFEAPPQRAINLISNQWRPETLCRLRLTTGAVPDVDQLERFLSVVASTLPNLTLLSLNMWQTHTPIPSPLSFTTFKPILGCRKINYFEVGHNQPMQINQAQILEMAEAWPDLEDLTLTEDPVLGPDTPRGLSLSILPVFAEKFPAIRELGLFLDGTPVPASATAPVFRNLVELNVGTSKLEPRHTTTVALWLSDLCYHPVGIVKGKSAWHVSGVWDLEEDDTPYLASGTAWTEVGRTIKSIYAHRQDKEKSRAEVVKQHARSLTDAVEQLTKGVTEDDQGGSLEAKVMEIQAALRRLQVDIGEIKPSPG